MQRSVNGHNDKRVEEKKREGESQLNLTHRKKEADQEDRYDELSRLSNK